MTPGLIPLKFGDKLKPVAIERFKMETGQKAIVAILSANIQGIVQHYHQNTGYFYCFGGECCTRLGLAGLRYIIPVLIYNVEKFPSKYGLPVSVQYLAAGKAVYADDLQTKQEILQAQEPPASITRYDMSCTCTEAQYQDIKFDLIGPNKWRKDAEMQKLVKEEHDTYKRLIEVSVARKMDEERLIELLDAPPAQGNRPNEPSKRASLPPRSKAPAPTQQRQIPATSSGDDLALDELAGKTGQSDLDDDAPVVTTSAQIPTGTTMPAKDAETVKVEGEGVDTSPGNPGEVVLPSGGSGFDDLVTADL